jgi:hypothetical protein
VLEEIQVLKGRYKEPEELKVLRVLRVPLGLQQVLYRKEVKVLLDPKGLKEVQVLKVQYRVLEV